MPAQTSITELTTLSARNQAQPFITKSKFFVPELNTAIIDGPLRIYFEEKNEMEALTLYCQLQDRLSEHGVRLNRLPPETPHSIVMLYPSQKSFENIFRKKSDKKLVSANWEQHTIVGLAFESLQGQEISPLENLKNEVIKHFNKYSKRAISN